jgi:hypothetical protein
MNNKLLDNFTQLAIPSLTIGAQFAVALKFPQWGLVINLMAQPFWIYSTWKSYKLAGQFGIFITTIIYSIVTALGVVNYWLL